MFFDGFFPCKGGDLLEAESGSTLQDRAYFHWMRLFRIFNVGQLS